MGDEGIEYRHQDVMDRDTGDATKDKDIWDLYLEGIEKACADVEKWYVLQEKVVMLKESILNERETNQLGIITCSHKENKRKYKDPSKNTGRKSNK